MMHKQKPAVDRTESLPMPMPSPRAVMLERRSRPPIRYLFLAFIVGILLQHQASNVILRFLTIGSLSGMAVCICYAAAVGLLVGCKACGSRMLLASTYTYRYRDMNNQWQGAPGQIFYCVSCGQRYIRPDG
jgi:hypothetical protein